MNRMFRTAALLLAIVALVLCFGACKSNDTPPVVDQLDDATTTVADATTTTSTTSYPTHTTVAVPENQLTLAVLLEVHNPVLAWSVLEPYDHKKTGDNTAEFVVADTFGHECKLNVTIDPASGNLTDATLSHKNVTASVLDESSMGLLDILTALNS